MQSNAALDYFQLAGLCVGRDVADVACPLCGPDRRAAQNRKRPVLRLWRQPRGISFNCARCAESGFVREDERTAPRPKPVKPRADNDRGAIVRQLWRETIDPRGTWAEDYLTSRGLRLPADPEILLRTLRFHPACPFPDKAKAPALVAAFTPIWTEAPDDPFLDPQPAAIHRIRGRGHDNKFMLGPVKGCAVMISPWWHVHEHLHVAEGVETALALCGQAHRPIWALSSAGAIDRFPVIGRVRRLVIWADNDASGTGIAAARECAGRWHAAGKNVTIRFPENEGADYAEDVQV